MYIPRYTHAHAPSMHTRKMHPYALISGYSEKLIYIVVASNKQYIEVLTNGPGISNSSIVASALKFCSMKGY